MAKYLIVADSKKSQELIKSLIDLSVYDQVIFLESSDKVKETTISQNVDVVIINAPLKEDDGLDLANSLSDTQDSLVIIIVPECNKNEVYEYCGRHGVFVISKPIKRDVFSFAIESAISVKNKISRLKNSQIDLQNKIEDIKIIDRAKYTLMEYLSLTEDQAHKYIESQAMNQRKTRRAVARDILKTYEM